LGVALVFLGASIVILFGVPGAPAFARQATAVSVTDLLAAPESFNGTTITVQGELVGDYGFRRDGSMWTQLDDDSYAVAPVVDGGDLTGANIGIGIEMIAEIGRELDPPGGYRVRGPIVRATGTWRYHDSARGGESYLEAASVEVVTAGADLTEGPNRVALGGGVALVGIAAVLWWMYRRDRDEA
jgi:hypothetical protein